MAQIAKGSNHDLNPGHDWYFAHHWQECR